MLIIYMKDLYLNRDSTMISERATVSWLERHNKCRREDHIVTVSISRQHFGQCPASTPVCYI